jgi:hypothetical protein
LEFTAVRAAEVEFIPVEANWDRIAWLPFSGGVALSSVTFVFPRVDNSLDVHDDGPPQRMSGGFTKDLGFRKVPVLGVVAFEGAAALVEFSGAAPYRLQQFRRMVPGSSRHAKPPDCSTC